ERHGGEGDCPEGKDPGPEDDQGGVGTPDPPRLSAQLLHHGFHPLPVLRQALGVGRLLSQSIAASPQFPGRYPGNRAGVTPREPSARRRMRRMNMMRRMRRDAPDAT